MLLTYTGMCGTGGTCGTYGGTCKCGKCWFPTIASKSSNVTVGSMQGLKGNEGVPGMKGPPGVPGLDVRDTL